jgi:predicted alpha/beta superfamily hydrolase
MTRKLNDRRFFALPLFIALALSTAGFGQSSKQILERKTGDRFITLLDFPDSGLTMGPRDIHVFLPPDYAQGSETYRVLYFNDGEGVFGGLDRSRGVYSDADYAHDWLLSERLIHPAILVAVANAKGVINGRGTDLVPRWTPESPGRGEEYYAFLATRLKPYIDAHFRTKPEARYTGVVGNSLGGLAAFYLGYRHPETFGLAGCMSPSLWTADSQLIRDVAADGRPRHTTRFWIDGGEKDAADIEIIAPRMTKILIEKGWREGDDVAFQLGYGHVHGRTAMRERLRDALYFLLRREPPAVRGLALKPLADPSASTLDLATAGDRAYIWPEIRYEHGFYLNSVAIPLRVDDSAIAVVDASEQGRIRAIGPGRSVLRAEFLGWKAELPVRGYNPGVYSRFPIPRVQRPPDIDGSLNEWASLPFTIEPKPGTLSASARFATAFDDRFVYVAIAVKDSRLVIRPDKPSTEQDGVEVWLDARADPMRSESKAQADGYQATFLLARLSPAISPSTAVPMPAPSLRSALPKDLKRACRLTANGYDAEIAIPVEYLNRMQGGDWQQFRLNVHLTDFVAAGEPKMDLWWQPAWRSMEALAGSGTFERR